MGFAHLATRAITAISTPTIGKNFADLMALGCQVITRFDDVDGVYLTIDDSPNPISTLSMLNELAKQEVQATFFASDGEPFGPISSRKFCPRAMRLETTLCTILACGESLLGAFVMR